MSDSLQPYGLQHARLRFLSPCPGVCSNPYPLSQCCYLTSTSSAALFSFCLLPFPALESFSKSQLFTSCGQGIRASASVTVIPMNIQGWFPLGMTSLISLLSKGLSGVFSSITIWKHQFFSAQPSLLSNSHIVHDYWKNQSFNCIDGPSLAKWCFCFLICCLNLL